MSRKTSKSSSNGNSAAQSAQGGTELRFINVSISEDAYGEVERLLDDMSTLAVKFMGLTALGYNVLVKRKRGSEDWLAMVTFPEFDGEGHDVALTAWGADPASATAALVYKWYDLLGEIVPDIASVGTRNVRRFG